MKLKISLLLGFVFSCLSMFGLGFFLHSLVSPSSPTVAPPVNVSPTPAPQNLNFTPGKQFYTDGFYLLAKDDPTLGLIVGVDRFQNNSNFSQSTRISLFSSSTTRRYYAQSDSKNLQIFPDKYISSWMTLIDPSRVLKESSVMSFRLPEGQIQVATNPLFNEMVVRSLPGYTKFFSNGTAKFSFNNVSHDAYIVYYHVNSNNSDEIHFYTDPLGITTHLLVLWDTLGQAYILDSTNVSRPTPLYGSHIISLFSDLNQSVFRNFAGQIQSDTQIPPQKYSLSLPEPINAEISLTTQKSINKSTTSTESWYISTVQGKVNRQGSALNAIGFMEYIKD